MPVFYIMFHGTNVQVEVDAESRVLGFYKGCFARAKDADSAVKRAREGVMRELARNGLQNPAHEPPLIAVEEVRETDLVLLRRSQGFTFYPQDRPDDAEEGVAENEPAKTLD